MRSPLQSLRSPGMRAMLERAERKVEEAYAVPPVERAARLLRAIADGDDVSNMSRTARAVGINRTTLMRLLHTLEAEHFIERRPDGEGYQIGLGLVGIAARAFYSQDIVQVALPVVARLAETVGLSAHLGMLDGTDAVYLVRRVPNVPLASNIHVGSRIPAHATTLGRIILAYRTKDEVDRLYAGAKLTRFTERTPASLPALHTLLARDRAAGLAWSDSYYLMGVSSFAGPVFDHAGRAIAAVNVTGPSAMFETPSKRHAIADAVRAGAREISERIGFIEPGEQHVRRL